MAKSRRRWPWFVGAFVLLGLLALVWLYAILHASLPILDGELTLAGLSAPVTIERDALGVPTIHAENRIDASRALGFLHGQARFFQMDLLRRSAAGELAGLFGEDALNYDQRIRLHRFRWRAETWAENLSVTDAKLGQAYTEGVNAGLSVLSVFPFEYLLLGQDPRPWQVADSALVVFAMYLDLQDETARYEATLSTLYQHLPEPVAEFFAPLGTEWDAPLQGRAIAQISVPAPELLDLRRVSRNLTSRQMVLPAQMVLPTMTLGSNNWAVSGKQTQNGAALLANDMHLGLQVPNIWYRARLIYPDTDRQMRSLIGVTLPGMPAVVVGSNGAIAWGFTNSYGDWSDRVLLKPAGEEHYMTPQGPEAYQQVEEIITIKGRAQPQMMNILETRWGPVLPVDYEGQADHYALSWVAHDPAAVNLELMRLESADTVAEALAIANRSGSPAQNIVVADKQGRIGWTIAGPIPRRQGFDGRLPVSWADGAGWKGWLLPSEYPRLIDPPGGLIWTANARVLAGEDLIKIGDGAYALGARAQQIRDSLQALDRADEDALLGIQLDDRALFLQRWRTLLLGTLDKQLDEQGEAYIPAWQELRDQVHGWDGTASINAVGYRLVRAFRGQTWNLTFMPLQAYLRQFDPSFEYSLIRQSEGPLWALLQARPQHYLPAMFQSWQELLLAAADRVINELGVDGKLSERSWGERNTLRMQHPFSRVVPWLGFVLDMPAEPLPGGVHMPRVQGLSQGASQRMVVAPGFEQDGIFHMPGGQSGHPLSPFYRAGHAAWARGEPSPLLPGPSHYELRLLP